MARPHEIPSAPDRAGARTALELVHDGWEHLQLQRPLAAWAAWQRALRIDPGHEAARQALATWESSPDLPASARAVYHFRPPGDESRRLRWDERFRGRDLGDLAEAAGVFAGLSDDDPGDAPARFNHALCLAWMGRNAEAIAALDAVVRLSAASDPDGAVLAWTLAEILRQGAGAEGLADDLRYIWVVDWSDEETARLAARIPGLRPLPGPPGLAAGNPDARVFEWLDRPMPGPTAPPRSSADVPRLLASVVATPRSLRLSSPDPTTLEMLHDPLMRAVEGPERAIRREATPLPLALVDADVWMFRLPPELGPDARRPLTREAVERHYEDRWIHRPRHGLDDRTPLEAGRAARSGDAVARVKLSAIVRLREQLGTRPPTAELYQGYPFDRLRRRVGLEPDDPAAVDPRDCSCMGAEELERLDPSSLDDDQLVEAYASASGLRDDRLAARFAARLVAINSSALARVVKPDLFATLVREAMRTDDRDRAFEWLDRAREIGDGTDRRVYDVWVAEIHSRTGEPDEAVRIYRDLLDRAGPDAALALSSAEDLLAHGYIEHASPLLRMACEQARAAGDLTIAERAEALLHHVAEDS